jgi:hypothetical protein
MNKHIFFDKITASIGAKVAGKKKFFSQSVDSLSFEELVQRTEIVVQMTNDKEASNATGSKSEKTAHAPEIKNDRTSGATDFKGGRTGDAGEIRNESSSRATDINDRETADVPEINGEGTFEVSAVTPAGILDPAFRVEKWVGTGYPTIIYHHGNNERPFDYRKGAKNTFLNIFVKARNTFDANLIVVRAPYHNSSLKEYQEKMTDLQNFMAMIAAAVKLNETLIGALRQHSDQPVITTGISLGGWVTNLHRALFNSADRYVPLMAGAFLGELFLESRYRKMTGENAVGADGVIRELLNFDRAFGVVETRNVFPLLAKYDQFIEYPVQVKSYEGIEVRTIENGHITGALNTRNLRNHVLAVLQTCCPQTRSNTISQHK